MNGACNKTNGKCECVSNNWSGALCDECSFRFYGPFCLPEARILQVLPIAFSVGQSNQTLSILGRVVSFFNFILFEMDANVNLVF